jgi:A/G-specific adenine glycosylase
MELGALICIPSQPRCPSCPVKNFCSYLRSGDKGKKRSGKKIRKEVWTVALVEQEGRFLLHRQEGKGLLAGLWQFPIVRVNKKGDAGELKKAKELKERKALRRMLQEKFGLKIKIKGSLPPQDHSFTHIQLTMKPFLCSVVRLSSALPVSKNVRWIKPVNFSRYPISRAMSKIAALILDPPPREATSG